MGEASRQRRRFGSWDGQRSSDITGVRTEVEDTREFALDVLRKGMKRFRDRRIGADSQVSAGKVEKLLRLEGNRLCGYLQRLTRPSPVAYVWYCH